jgi:hypothetical protein
MSEGIPTGPTILAAPVRQGIYLLLIAVAVGNMTGRLLSVNSVDKSLHETEQIKRQFAAARQKLTGEGLVGDQLRDRLALEEDYLRKKLQLQRPFLSSNDRSRWATIRSLVERGTYEIDAIVGEPTIDDPAAQQTANKSTLWDTIDKIQHVGRDGRPHFYSSKPPLLATLIAGEYWLINWFSGATLRDYPYEIGRAMLLTINVLPMVVMFVLLARIVERFGTTDWGRIFAMACATLGTFLNTFAVVLNNHVLAAVTAAVALYAAVRILCDGERRLRYFAIAGFFAALTGADELPALTLTACLGTLLLYRAPRQTLLGFVPAVAVVAAAFIGTNWLAHQSLKPPYMHPEWYDYQGSYWRNREGIDVGEPSRAVYAVNMIIGHHGIFSLTPIWLLSVLGTAQWLVSRERGKRELAAMVTAITVVCLVFYIGIQNQQFRNYGGMTSGLRWMFWCSPLWIVMLISAADRLARSRFGKVVAAALLSFSVLSASYPTWNPWTQPWIYNWMVWCGWPGY